jgi:hypothetical protein
MRIERRRERRRDSELGVKWSRLWLSRQWRKRRRRRRRRR